MSERARRDLLKNGLPYIIVGRRKMFLIEDIATLLTGGTKQRQQRDIARAKEFWRDYKRRRKPSAR